MPRITITIDVPDGTAVAVGGNPASTHTPNNRTPDSMGRGLASEKQQKMIWARGVHGAGLTKGQLQDLVAGIAGVSSLRDLPYKFVDPILKAIETHKNGGVAPEPEVEDDEIPF